MYFSFSLYGVIFQTSLGVDVIITFFSDIMDFFTCSCLQGRHATHITGFISTSIDSGTESFFKSCHVKYLRFIFSIRYNGAKTYSFLKFFIYVITAVLKNFRKPKAISEINISSHREGHWQTAYLRLVPLLSYLVWIFRNSLCLFGQK